MRRTLALVFLLACGLSGCGGTGTVATGPTDGSLVDVASAAPAPTPETTTTVAPAVPEPTTAVPTTEAPAPPPTAAARRVVATTAAPEPEPEPEIYEAVTPEPTGTCDPSYPGVCIAPGPPDLDCADVPYRRFTVIGADPHRFDGNDNDGIGCESN